MSHITKIDLVVKDLDAMAKACSRLGLELVRGQRTFAGYTQGTCEHAIRVKGATVAGAYEIGLTKRADGKGFKMKWDGGMGQYEPAAVLYEKVGYDKLAFGKPATFGKLQDWYAAEVARKQMSKQGFMVTAVQRAGKVQVLCRK